MMCRPISYVPFYWLAEGLMYLFAFYLLYQQFSYIQYNFTLYLLYLLSKSSTRSITLLPILYTNTDLSDTVLGVHAQKTAITVQCGRTFSALYICTHNIACTCCTNCKHCAMSTSFFCAYVIRKLPDTVLAVHALDVLCAGPVVWDEGAGGTGEVSQAICRCPEQRIMPDTPAQLSPPSPPPSKILDRPTDGQTES